jgi:uncharacterized protein (TIGR03083 family)
MIPREPPADYPSLFRVERARLLALLRALTSDEWSLPTRCPGWTVLGIAYHLLGDDLGWLAWNRDHHHGTPAPAGADEAGFITWLDELQAGWVDAARRISPQLTAGLLDWLSPQLEQAMRAQAIAGTDANVSWASDAPVPGWLDHARELTERWIHRQQILEAVGQPSDLGADLADPVLEALRWAYPFRLGAHWRPRDTTVDVRITGELARTWRLQSTGGGWIFDPEASTEPAATLTVTSDQGWRLLTNNYRVEQHGSVSTTGDPKIVSTLLNTRAIIGTPK